jgi:hypothetical protein
MKPTARDLERRVDDLEGDEDEDDGGMVVEINHEHVDRNGDVVDRETEVIELGGSS